jgi:hypothetical protein
VVLAREDDKSRVCRVDAPDRVLRIWALLNSADGELHQVKLPPGATGRLRRQLDAFTVELEQSVSPALGRELRQLIPPRGAADVLTTRQLQLEYASLLGWTGGLVTGMIFQLQAAGVRPVQPGLAAARETAGPYL